jgi:hypothetical protein
VSLVAVYLGAGDTVGLNVIDWKEQDLMIKRTAIIPNPF